METSKPQTGFAKPMTDTDFDRLSEFIRVQCGVKMPPVKKIMLEARLQKRLRSLGLKSFHDYCELLFGSPAEADEELVHMIDAITTNKTDFFREPSHFQFLTETLLPEQVSAAGIAGGAYTVWSAGCSSGEEPYTLAMVLGEFQERCPGFRYSVLATDISTKVLEKAMLGMYDEDRVAAVPAHLKQKYLMRSKDRSRNLVRVVPELRSLIRFQRVNLMDEDLATAAQVDVIFCRNVIIYFERETQYKLLLRLCRSLKAGGHLFLGHSETVHGFDLPLVRVMSTVYRKAP
jgi:chemotaxis protein methyltransferase CheR